MTVFVFDASLLGGKWSGGVAAARLYNDLNGFQINIPVGVDVLQFTGNAHGFLAGDGISGGTGADTLIGLNENDRFHGGAGDDTISGGNGDDLLDGGTGANVLDGGSGSDFAQISFADQSGDVVAVNGGVAGVTYGFTVGGVAFGSVINVEVLNSIIGGTGNDRLGGVYTLTSMSHTVTSGAGNDVVVVDLSADVAGIFSGGPTIGRIYNQTTGFQINIDLGTEALEYTGNASGTSAADGIFGGTGNDILNGLDSNDIFHGGTGNDTINGGGGNDRLDGGTGANVIDGGTGDDIAQLDLSDQTGDIVAVNGGVAGVTYNITVAGAAFGSLTNIEVLNNVKGGTGNDRLGGVYTLTSMSHTIVSGAGDDVVVVDLSADTTGVFSGGPNNGARIYNQTTGFQINIDAATETLIFTGNANGTSAANGVFGGIGNDILTGLDKNDIFNGGAGNDTISGGLGNDWLNGGKGANVIDGGDGLDHALFDFSDQTGDVVAVNGGVKGVTYGFTVGGAAFGSVKNVEIVTSLLGGSGNDKLGGVYTLTGPVNHTIVSGAGDDVVVVDLSADTTGIFSGGPNNGFRIYNQVNGFQINIDAATETLIFTGNAHGTAAADGIFGGIGDDILTGLTKNDIFHGGLGNDTLIGGVGDDRLDGGKGANVIEGGVGYDVALFDFSDQTLNISIVNKGVPGVLYTVLRDGKAYGSVRNVEVITTLIGGKGDDRLGGVYTLTKSNHTIVGGDGKDVVVVDLSADTAGKFSGGPNNGARIYNQTTGWQLNIDAATEALEFTGNATGTAAADGVYGGIGADILTGLGGNDVFHGGAGNDTISGGLGNDRLDGGTGANVIDGGDGIDTAQWDFSDHINDVVLVNGGVANTVYGATVGGIAFGSVKNVEFLSVLNGGAGNDRLGGVYTLVSMHHTINGFGGNDVAVIDLSADTAGKFSGGPNNGARIYNETTGFQFNLSNIEAIEFIGNATGTAAANGVFGGKGNDKLTGLTGNDRFSGEDGDDRLRGAGGNDILNGGKGIDTAVFSGKYSAYSFKFNPGSLEVSGPDGNDVLTDIEALEFDDGSIGVGVGALGSTVSISADQVTKAEGNPGPTAFTFTVSRSGAVNVVETVNWTVSGTGAIKADGLDFAGGGFPFGKVTFGVGETSKTITVNVAGDTTVEPNESFAVILSAPSIGITIATATATSVIQNDDVNPPGLPDLAAASDKGASSTDNVTNVTTPTFTGTATPALTVNLFADGVLVGSGKANAAGVWSIKSGALTPGVIAITAKAVDGLGNVSPVSPTLSVTIDTTAPSAPGVPDLKAVSDSGKSNSDNITKVTTPIISGTAEVGTTVTLQEGATVLGSAKTNALGVWTITTGVLSEGKHTMNARATDLAGNVSAFSSALTVTIDTTPPVAPVVTGATITSLTGTAEVGSLVSLIDNGIPIAGSVTTNGAGVWTKAVTLSAGAHAITGTSTDAAGNVRAFTTPANVIIGTAGPDVLIGPAGPLLMAGGNGNDIYHVDDSATVISETATQGSGDTVLASVDYTLGSAARIEFLSADVGAPGLVLTGNAFANTITGGIGNDMLTGGGGADTLTGGGGVNVFVFTALTDSGVAGAVRDVITDFQEAANHIIDLHLIDADSITAGDQPFFLGGAAFTGVAGELIQTPFGADTRYQGDVNGDSVADFAFVLSGSHTLTNSNFVF